MLVNVEAKLAAAGNVVSSKYPDDGYTDAELIEEMEQHRVAQSLGILEDYTRYEDKEKEGAMEVDINLKDGGVTRPFYVNNSVAVRPSEVDSIGRDILRSTAFRGRWQTFLNGSDLMVPGDYHDLLKDGGVITTGPDVHLMIFGKRHWERMEMMIASQLGVDFNRVNVMRHIYMHHAAFDGLNPDGSITLSDELINYAGLRQGVDADGKGFVIMVGLIYYAEVYDKQSYDDMQLSADDVRGLAAALK